MEPFAFVLSAVCINQLSFAMIFSIFPLALGETKTNEKASSPAYLGEPRICCRWERFSQQNRLKTTRCQTFERFSINYSLGNLLALD